jgi:hypothetical protein
MSVTSGYRSDVYAAHPAAARPFGGAKFSGQGRVVDLAGGFEWQKAQVKASIDQPEVDRARKLASMSQFGNIRYMGRELDLARQFAAQRLSH